MCVCTFEAKSVVGLPSDLLLPAVGGGVLVPLLELKAGVVFCLFSVCWNVLME